ncbi:DUF1501 domain-containing protein [Tuwongella immobilis]|nr:DUF1501 domain-containing protein [Tuwongella immobilis]
MSRRSHACESLRRHLSRREMLRIGSLAPVSLALTDLMRPTASAAPAASRPKSRAKSVILLFMWGGPSHLDTWDPKPNAPVEVRGEFQSIPTTVPGLRISEHFPLLAQRAHQYTVIRSMAHTDPAHLSPVHHLMTGRVAAKPNSDADGPSRSDAPCMGAMVQKLMASDDPMPRSVTLPWAVSHPAAPGGTAPGQNAGWMGPGMDPFLITGNPNLPTFAVNGLTPQPDMSTDRMASRAALAQQLDAAKSTQRDYVNLRSKAFDLLTSPKVAAAFDLNREPASMRDKYGRHPHGQSCLLARRMIEAGTRLVTVNWPDDGQAFWDTHGNNFPSLKDRLMPPADRGFAALLDDLTARGMLDETLVVWIGEFGRTPRAENGGRQHWPRCYSAVMAGGGIRGGAVYGASDAMGGEPVEHPVSPADITATIYEALGIAPDMPVLDRLGRELALTEGRPLVNLFG